MGNEQKLAIDPLNRDLSHYKQNNFGQINHTILLVNTMFLVDVIKVILVLAIGDVMMKSLDKNMALESLQSRWDLGGPSDRRRWTIY